MIRKKKNFKGLKWGEGRREGEREEGRRGKMRGGMLWNFFEKNLAIDLKVTSDEFEKQKIKSESVNV